MRNPNTSLENKNTLYIGRSGSGKSQALKQNKTIPARGARVVLWDTNNDHKAKHYYNMVQFIRALDAANRQNWQTGQGFRIAYAGVDSIVAYDMFCSAYMQILDGRRITFGIVEELSAVCLHAGKARPLPAKMMNQVRKYGGVIHATTQKPQEVSKTYFDQCEIRFIGMQKSLRQKKLMCEEVGVSMAELEALKPLEFWHDKGQGKPKRIKLKYKS